MAGVRFADVQSRPSEFLNLTSLTLEEFQVLVAPFEAAFQDHMAAWRLDGKPRTRAYLQTRTWLILSYSNSIYSISYHNQDQQEALCIYVSAPGFEAVSTSWPLFFALPE